MAAVIAALVAVAIGLAYDKRVATVFVVSSVAVFVLLRAIAAGLMALARRMPRSRITMLRLAISNIYRPGALTPSVVLSLGLGLAVLVTITQIDGNLRRQFLAALPDRAPSFYFIDIPSSESERFGVFLRQVAADSTIEEVPMLRGRIVAARGVKSEELKPSNDSEWVLQSDRGLTYTGEIPKGSEGSRRRMVGRRLSGPAAGLDGEEDRRRPEARDRRRDRGQCARPRHPREDRQSPQHRLAGARHQFRAGVLAQRLQGRAAQPYRHPDRGPSRSGRRRPDHQAGRRRLPDGDERAGARGAGDHRRRHHQSRAGDPRRQRRDPDLGHPGAGRGACRRPSPPRL